VYDRLFLVTILASSRAPRQTGTSDVSRGVADGQMVAKRTWLHARREW
jgi:hypothetical protein